MDSQTVQYVRQLFNDMAEEYDNQDFWYSYTFGTIDGVIKKYLQPASYTGVKPIALDLGCGTGIQSIRLAEIGYRVIGVDIADKLLDIAEAKLRKRGYHDATFRRVDIEALPFDDGVADVVNCCGPTLSFVQDWRKALSEMSRCLRPGGKLLLEVEGKWNCDLFWEIISGATCNSLGYDEKLSDALGHLLPPWTIGHTIDYSFKTESGGAVVMPLRLFTASELRSELRRVGLVQARRWGLHVITNLIPSTVLHQADLGRWTAKGFKALAAIERGINGVWPFNALGCSLLVTATKSDPGL